MLLDTARGGDFAGGAPVREAPLFTGTLLSTRGSTVDHGHMVVEPYFYLTRFGGLYNNIGGCNRRPPPGLWWFRPTSSMD